MKANSGRVRAIEVSGGKRASASVRPGILGQPATYFVLQTDTPQRSGRRPELEIAWNAVGRHALDRSYGGGRDTAT